MIIYTKLFRQAIILLSTAIASVGIVCAAPYAAGDKVDAFSAEDQHGNAFTLKPAQTNFLLVTHDMKTGKKANGFLTHVGPENLKRDKLVYLANIHGMPGIGRFFALPKMRKYSHTIILGDDPDLIAKFPEEDGKVTVLKLRRGKVVSVKYWDPTADKLKDFLK